MATEEVIQLYIKDQESPDAPANPILCGFLRTQLQPGESKQLYIPIDPEGLTVVNAEGKRVPGSGSWKLYAHIGQPDSRTEELTGKKAVEVVI